MIENTEAFVLHSRKYGETSKIVEVYGKTSGKISLIAKGARKAKSKFGATLNPGARISINYYYKKTRNLHLLSSSDLVNSYRSIYEDFDKLTAAYSALEAVLYTQQTEEVNEELYELVGESLELIDGETDRGAFSVLFAFLLRFVAMLGFAIDLSVSLPSGKDNAYFSLESGILIEGDEEEAKDFFKISSEAYLTLQEISSSSSEEFARLKINQNLISEIHNFFVNYLSYHLDKRIVFKSMKLWKSLSEFD